MISTPKAPDPLQTAQTQSSLNRDTAITQAQLNSVNQITPYGSLTYSQTGNAFSPSDTGQKMYYNASTGAYSSSAPFQNATIAGTPGSTGVRHKDTVSGEYLDSQGRPWVNGTKDTQSKQLQDGWTEVKGNLTPQYTATTTLSPAQQKILDQTNGASLNLASLANDRSAFLKDYLGQSMDTSGAPALQSQIGGGYSGNIGGSYATSYDPGYQTSLGGNYTTDLGNDYKTTYAGADDFGTQRKTYEDAILARQAPQQAQDADRLRTQLISSGIRPGTAAYDAALQTQQAGVNDARNAAILSSGQEQSRLVGLEADRANFTNSSLLNRAAFGNQSELAQAQFRNDAIANRFGAQNAASLGAAGFRNDAAANQAQFGNAARSQYMNEAYAARNQPLNEIGALLSGAQVQQPNFVNTPQTGVGGVDYTGLVSNQYNSQVQAQQGAMGGLFGLGAAAIKAIPWSDRRLKKDIRVIGSKRGLPWYEFRYIWSEILHEGFMADDVKKVMPKAVIADPSGFDKVDYSMILEAA